MRQGLPFPISEYRDRAERVRARMREREVDVLFVTSPANLCYLTGFESIWYPPRAPVAVVVAADSDRLVFCDYERHETLARETAHYDDAVFYRYEDVLDTIADTFRGRGWLDGAIGIERWSPAPGAPLLDALAARLGELGGRIVSGDWVVDRVRLVKSPAELVCVRRAGEIVDAAFAALPGEVRLGMTELQIASRLDGLMAELGGEPAAIRTMVSAGPDVWARTHGAPGRRPVERGDVMYVDACGVVDRYHVDVCRTFAFGVPNEEAAAILEVTGGSVLEVQAAVRPGDPLDVAQRIAEEYVFSRFPREQVWWVGGYALGLSVPPNWVGHTYLSNDAFEQFTWEPGYVTNYENILFGREGGFTASYMETLLMNGDGIEILSSRPRGLTVIG